MKYTVRGLCGVFEVFPFVMLSVKKHILSIVPTFSQLSVFYYHVYLCFSTHFFALKFYIK